MAFNFERFKEALRKREEEQFEKLKKEIKELKTSIEIFLTKFLESTSNHARTNYYGLYMH